MEPSGSGQSEPRPGESRPSGRSIVPEGVELQRPHPKLAAAKYIGSLGWLVIAAIGAALLLVIPMIFKGAQIPLWVWLLVVLPWVLFWAVTVFRVRVFMRNHGFALLEDDYMVASGAWFREVVAVPYGRIQYAKVSQGPLLRRYGLASVELHSAASSMSATVQGLTLEDAEALKERLVSRGSAQLAGL